MFSKIFIAFLFKIMSFKNKTFVRSAVLDVLKNLLKYIIFFFIKKKI